MKNQSLRSAFFFVAFTLLTTATAHAQLTDESELSLVNIDGNATSESYSARQKNVYQQEANSYSIAGRYLRAKSGGTETARSWDATLRYERSLSEHVSTYVAQGAESDPYNGNVERDNSDLGGKYFFVKSEPLNFFMESGYRYTKANTTDGNISYYSLGRVYVEYAEKYDETLNYKLWVEYLPNFTDSKAYYMNGEPSLSFVLSSYLSLRVAYLMKYHNLTIQPNEKRLDTTFTTSLVARF